MNNITRTITYDRLNYIGPNEMSDFMNIAFIDGKIFNLILME